MTIAAQLHSLVVFSDAHPVVVAVVAAFGLAGCGLIVRAIKATARSTRAMTSAKRADVFTLAVAGIATTVSAWGMWRFFGDVLHAPAALRVAVFAFLELAVFAEASRARLNIKSATHSAGVDGIAVWALTAMSAVLSALDAGSVRAAMLRLLAPLVAAFLWERGLSIERHRVTGRSGRINWRITPERVLVRLGLAEASDRTAGAVDAHRRMARLTRAAHKVQGLRARDARPGRQRRAVRALDRAMDAAVEHAGLATDPARQAELLAQLGARYNAGALADLTPDAPWQRLALPARTEPRTESAHEKGPRADNPHPPGRTEPAHSAPDADSDPTRDPHPMSRTTVSPELPAARIDRDALVSELTGKIHDAVDAGETWRPDYADLIRRSGYKRRWCEEVVRDARTALFPADDTEPARGASAGDSAQTAPAKHAGESAPAVTTPAAPPAHN